MKSLLHHSVHLYVDYLVQKLSHFRCHVALGAHNASSLEVLEHHVLTHGCPVFSHLEQSGTIR